MEQSRERESAEFRLVLLGDLHVYRLWTWPWLLLSKRLLGQTNVWLNRRSIFHLEDLPAVVERALSYEPDLVLQVGDLTSTALESEFQKAAEYLKPLFAGNCLILPGNHDRYTFSSSHQKRLEKYFRGQCERRYPFTRRLRDDLFLVGLDPTRPRWFDASGRLGEEQLEAFRRHLGEIPPGARLIVACHYPLGSPPGFTPEPDDHGLKDKGELVRALRDAGREILYLHGHVHEPWCWRLPRASTVVAVNSGAPVLHDPIHPGGQGFWFLRSSSGRSWQLTRCVRTEEGSWVEREVTWPETPDEVAEIDWTEGKEGLL